MTNKELERRRKKYKFVLVLWYEPDERDDYYAIERKTIVDTGWEEGAHYKVMCDYQPRRVLEGMLKLLEGG